jgi:hypothetical protein
MAIGNLDPSTDQKFVEKLEASLEKKEDEVSKVSPTPPTSRPMKTAMKAQTNKRTNERTNKRLKVKTNKRTNVRTVKVSKSRKTVLPKEEVRRKARHSFDIFEDQALSLKEIQLARQKETGKRCLLGDLVKEALDMFIAKEHIRD